MLKLQSKLDLDTTLHLWSNSIWKQKSIFMSNYQTHYLVIKHHINRRPLPISILPLMRRAYGEFGFHDFSHFTAFSKFVTIHKNENQNEIIYSTVENTLDMVISKLDPNTLDVLATYKTNWRKKWAGNAFMACGVLYVLKKCDWKENYLNYAYDTHTKQWRHIQVFYLNKLLFLI